MDDAQQLLLRCRTREHLGVVEKLPSRGGTLESTDDMGDFLAIISLVIRTINRIVMTRAALTIQLEVALSLLLFYLIAYVIGLVHTCERPNFNCFWCWQLGETTTGADRPM